MLNHDQDPIIIFDTTLRDGEQAPGATMALQQKIEIAETLDGMGVDVIEAGFAAASTGDFESIEQICKIVKNASVCSLARAKIADIEAAASSIKSAVKPRLHTFISTSDIHLIHQFKITREEVLDVIKSSVQTARRLCEDVEWSAMDATRSNVDFLARAIEIAIKAGARTINIPDTVGYATPYEYGQLIRVLKEKIPNADKAIFSVHCHNDLGLAVANSLAAIQAGARQIECTVNGIGERAGNAALEEIVMAIKTRQDQFPFAVNVNASHIANISQMVSSASGFAVQKNKAIVGANAFAHESGIHQDGMLKCRETYEVITPESVGFKTALVMGKHSGRAAFRDKLKQLNISAHENEFNHLFEKFKALGDTQKTITDDDVLAMVHQKTPTNTSQKKMDVVWMDGKFISKNDANISIFTHALHYASAVFEGERAYNGQIFKLNEHNTRLHHSAHQLGFQIPYTVAELNAISHQLLMRNQLQDAYVRPIAWLGDETLGVASHRCNVHVAIMAWTWTSYFSDSSVATNGLKLLWADWAKSNPSASPFTAKASGLYVIGSMSKNKAEQAGFHDALLLDHRGYVAECSSSNIFFVKNGTIHTPIADCFLNGITRQTVIALANAQNVPVIERHIHPDEVYGMDEIFVTGSAVEIAPVSQIEGNVFKVGTITKQIQQSYAALVRGHEKQPQATSSQLEEVFI